MRFKKAFVLALAMLVFTGCDSGKASDIKLTAEVDTIAPIFTVSTTKADITTKIPQNSTGIETKPQESDTLHTEESDFETETAVSTEKIVAPETKIPEQTTSVSTTIAPQEPSESGYAALNYDIVKGVWISYIDLSEMLTGKSESQFRTNISAAFDNVVSLGLNTVYVHVRPFGDALYPSDYFPWSAYCAGTLGEKPDFDPLEIMVSAAHERKLSFQAWINPMRLMKETELVFYGKGALYDLYSAGKLSAVGGRLYINPAYSDGISLISLGAQEILSNYDVDGIHIDDYFYPTTDTSFDSAEFAQSGYSDLAYYRRENCSAMVKALYSGVKAANSTALFGISAAGNIDYNVNTLYADVEKWCGGGFADYMAPQIYFGFENSSLPFDKSLDEWRGLVSASGLKLIPGLAVYKIGAEDTWAGGGKYEWLNSKEIIKRQILLAQEESAYSGVILYDYRHLFTVESTLIDEEIAAFKPVL